jgi:hypothetical protein
VGGVYCDWIDGHLTGAILTGDGMAGNPDEVSYLGENLSLLLDELPNSVGMSGDLEIPGRTSGPAGCFEPIKWRCGLLEVIFIIFSIYF